MQRRTHDRNGKNNNNFILKAKNKLVIRSIKIKKKKRKMLCFNFKKKTSEKRKRHCFNGFFRISWKIRHFRAQQSLLK